MYGNLINRVGTHIINALIFYFLVFNLSVKGQKTEKSNQVILGFHSYNGMILPHDIAIEPVSHTNPRGFEFNFALHLMSEDVWQYGFCYPRIGVAFHYVDFANKDVVGSAFALYPYIEPFIGAGRRVSWGFRLGAGLSYQTHIYDEANNPLNKFFGSHYAFIAMLNSSLNYKFSPKVSARFTASFNHISNGGTIRPNYGINYPMIGLGVDYIFNPIEFEKREKDRSIVLNEDKNRLDIALFYSGRKSQYFEEWYPVYGLWGGYSRMISRINALYAGGEIVSDILVRKTAEEAFRTGQIDEIPDHLRISLLAGHEFVLGRFIFSQYLGIYVYSPVEARDFWYQRYALLYQFMPKTWIGINIRSHLDIVDFIDLRLTRSF